MTETKRYPLGSIWIFVSLDKTHLQAFENIEDALYWIRSYRIYGILNLYPLNEALYDWAISRNYFKPKYPSHLSANFIENFSCASLEHFHFTCNSDFMQNIHYLDEDKIIPNKTNHNNESTPSNYVSLIISEHNIFPLGCFSSNDLAKKWIDQVQISAKIVTLHINYEN